MNYSSRGVGIKNDKSSQTTFLRPALETIKLLPDRSFVFLRSVIYQLMYRVFILAVLRFK